MLNPTQKKTNRKLDYISYSALKDFQECPYKFKLTRIDKIKAFNGNIHTAFGNACHSAIEDALTNREKIEKETGSFDIVKQFQNYFPLNITELPTEEKEKISEQDISAFTKQGEEIMPEVLPYLNKHFAGYEVIATEQRLDESFSDYKLDDFRFIGYIDAILRTPDGKFHVIDWKTTSWGWDVRRKSDKMTTYQLTLYKEFLCRKLSLDPKLVVTHFALLKRTGKDKVEIFPVSSGEKKVNNAVKMLYNAVYNIDHENFIKRKTSCRGCPFSGTEYCDGR